MPSAYRELQCAAVAPLLSKHLSVNLAREPTFNYSSIDRTFGNSPVRRIAERHARRGTRSTRSDMDFVGPPSVRVRHSTRAFSRKLFAALREWEVVALIGGLRFAIAARPSTLPAERAC
jgi:hypothetical protein